MLLFRLFNFLLKLDYVCRSFILMLSIAFSPSCLHAEDVKVAVAANFTAAAKEIGATFEKSIGHKAVFSFGSTGQLYAQIFQGAPFDIFLAADQKHPQRAIEDGLADAQSRFTYATGQIVLFSKDQNLVKGAATLSEQKFTKIAIANPPIAPYGAAALDAMKALGVYDRLKSKIVQGNNVAQTYQFIETGNAELGFVALSQIAGNDIGSRWIVPAELYPTIAQDAVLLTQGAEKQAAHAFLTFLRGSEARGVIKKYGYGNAD